MTRTPPTFQELYPGFPDPELEMLPFERLQPEESLRRAETFDRELKRRRTDYVKAHLTDAPRVVVLFREKYGLRADGTTFKNDYTTESVSIAAGLFIAAVHHAGLCTLTHTPNPMKFLGELLGRPASEEAMLVMPVGYPAQAARMPKLERKQLAEIFRWTPELLPESA